MTVQGIRRLQTLGTQGALGKPRMEVVGSPHYWRPLLGFQNSRRMLSKAHFRLARPGQAESYAWRERELCKGRVHMYTNICVSTYIYTLYYTYITFFTHIYIYIYIYINIYIYIHIYTYRYTRVCIYNDQ